MRGFFRLVAAGALVAGSLVGVASPSAAAHCGRSTCSQHRAEVAPNGQSVWAFAGRGGVVFAVSCSWRCPRSDQLFKAETISDLPPECEFWFLVDTEGKPQAAIELVSASGWIAESCQFDLREQADLFAQHVLESMVSA